MDRNPTETARKMAQQAFTRLAAEIQAGRSEALTNYLTAMSRFRGQSRSNVLLIAAQRPNATQVASIHAWNDLGRRIKGGEKGILVFAQDETKQVLALSQAQRINDPFRITGSRAAYVFDVSQTEGSPLAERTLAVGTREAYHDQLGKLIVKSGIDPRHAEAVGYVVSRALGLETRGAPLDALIPYNGDKRALTHSLAVIHETSNQILDVLLPEERIQLQPPVAASQREPAFRLDAVGFGALHSQYHERVIQSIAGLVRDRDRAEEIASRAFQSAWAKRGTFRGEASPYTWVQSIARNAARESRVQDRISQFDSIDHPEAREIPAPALVTDKLEKEEEDRRWLQKAIAQLPAKNRRPLVAHFIDGHSIRDIARRERVPFGTVLSRIHKAKQLLREAWEQPLTPRNSEPAPSSKPQGNRAPQSKAPEADQGREVAEPINWDH